MRGENRNVMWADALARELARAGLAEVCVASGSRSSPLVLSLATLAARGTVRLFPHVDERSAAFFALGMGKATGRAAAVVTTSGTAVANLLPAVVEAAQAEVPLLVITADRPGHLRGTDANQTIDQARLFGTFARAFHDVPLPRIQEDMVRHLRSLAGRAMGETFGPPAGPVHLNLQFGKPLESTRVPGDIPPDFEREAPLAARGRPHGAPYTRVHRGLLAPEPDSIAWLEERVRSAERGLLVCGPAPEPWRTGPAALALAATTGWPLLADALSGARFGSSATEHAVDGYDLLLGSPEVSEALEPDLVLRLGANSTSAALLRFLDGCGEAEQVVVDGGGRWKDHRASAAHYLRMEPAALCDALGAALKRSDGPAGPASWRERWKRVGAAVRRAVDGELRRRPFEGTVLAEVARLAPAGATLFVASSMPVRDLDAFAGPREAPLLALGHRGASGIDGSVSAALGAAVARAPAPAVAVLGDMAFYHDLNGLLAARQVTVDLTILVIHNDGGGIFHFLPVREETEAFEPLVAMPHGLDFSHAAALYGLPYRRLADAGECLDLPELVRTRPGSGVRIVEVPSDREENRRRHEEIQRVARRAGRQALAVGAAG